MRVMPIEWHKKCLQNATTYLEREIAELERMKRNVDRLREQTEFAKQQILEAERQGKDRFDPDKFLSKLRKNSQKTSET